MKIPATTSRVVGVVCCLMLPIAAQASWQNPAKNPARTAASAVCAGFSGISGSGAAAAGYTSGIVGTPAISETYTITVQGPGTGTFRIVADASGATTYAGPANVPATLSYTITAASPLVEGVGYFFDSGSGNVTITASCTAAAANASPTPTLGAGWLTLLGGLLAAIGMALGRSRRQDMSR